MYTEEELKKIKISIKQNIPMAEGNENEEIIDYSFSNDEKLPVHIRPFEGTKPLFYDEFANRTSTTNQERYPSRLSSRQNSPDHRQNEKRELETVLHKLEDMLDEIKEKTKEAERDVRNANKRSRSRDSSYSDCSIHTGKKRMRRDSKYSDRHKYGHSSRYNIDNDIDNKRKNRYRDDRSRSSSSDRSYSSYLSRKLEKDMSSLLNDTVLSNHSRRSDYKHSRNSKKNESKYRKSRRSEKREENYNHGYYRHDSYYHNMKERYARYYTVMYAFNIIMDILRKDDLYNNHY